MKVSQHHKNTISKMDLEEMMVLNSFLVSQIKKEQKTQSSPKTEKKQKGLMKLISHLINYVLHRLTNNGNTKRKSTNK